MSLRRPLAPGAAPRALIAAPFYPPHVGGIERYSAGVAGELRARGWEVDILACSQQPPYHRRTGPAGERVYELASTIVAGRLPVPLPTHANRKLVAQLRAQRYGFALIQSHLFLSGLLATGVTPGAPRVWLNHGSGHVPAGHGLASRGIAAYEHVLAGVLRRRVHAVAAVSVEAADWLGHLGVRRACSVGNAVTEVVGPRRDRPEGPLRVLYAGRLESGKGADVAIDVVRQAREAGPITLTVCGDGTQRAAVLDAIAADSGMADYRGPVSHEALLELMANHDVFIYPSTYPEGFPTVLLEAGSRGCAVLTYPVAGSAELLAEGGGWRVADAREAVAALGEAARDPQGALELGEALRRSVAARFTWRHVVHGLLAVAGVPGAA